MRYVGCKRRLLPFIHDMIKANNIHGHTFCDLFAGTATVGHYFKQWGFKIISCDLLYTSYICQQVKVAINQMPSFKTLAQHLGLYDHSKNNYGQVIIDYLNQLTGIEGFIYQHYSPGGTSKQAIKRLYYSDDNAKKIDVIREMIEAWKQLDLINTDEFYLLLYALLDAASNYANTTGVMSSFLKTFNRKSLRKIQLTLPEITSSSYSHQVYCQNSLNLLEKLDYVDILYLDPPYTGRQYAAAYHLLETIARWDFPTLYGISGKRDIANLASPLNRKTVALDALKQIVASACYRYLLVSYSSDSLISHDRLMSLFQAYGEVTVQTHRLKRYNSLSENDPRYHPCPEVGERLYYLKPERACTHLKGDPMRGQQTFPATSSLRH